MDGDTLELILERINENHQDWKDVKKSIESIQASLVGTVHCDAYRLDFSRKLQSHDDQIRELKTVCDGYMATKPDLINEVDLKEAKDDAIQRFGARYDGLEERVRVIENYVKLIGFVWENPAVKTLLIGSFLTMVGVYWGRIGQYGWHVVAIFLGAMALVSILVWISKRNTLNAAKETTKKLMRL